MILSFILITYMFDQVMILWGEIARLSLLGLKGLKRDLCNSLFNTTTCGGWFYL